MNPRFKVLFLASWYPSEDHSIDGIFIKRHAQAVSKYCDVAVLYVHQSKHRKHTEIEYSIEDKVKTVRVYSRVPPFKNRLLSIFFRLFNNHLINSYKGLKVIRKEFGRPDVVHLNVVLIMGYIAIILDVFKGIPFVLTEHTSPFNLHLKTFTQRSFVKIILKKAKYVMPVSSALEKQIKSFYKKCNYKIIPNVIDTGIFTPSLNSKDRSTKKKIVHVSLLIDDQKNISGILKAIKLLSEKREDFELHIVGDGKDKDKLETVATKLNIINRFVFFHGRLSDNEVTYIMRTSDFFVLNSYHETFAIVCAEALSSGIPVISTRCGGPEDYVNEEVGILIEPGNIEELVKAMDYMLDNNGKYDPKMLHDYAEKRFGYEVVSKQFYEIYLRTINERF